MDEQSKRKGHAYFAASGQIGAMCMQLMQITQMLKGWGDLDQKHLDNLEAAAKACFELEAGLAHEGYRTIDPEG